MSGLVLVDPGSEFLQDTLTSKQWAKFVEGAKTPGEPKDLEAADYQPSVDALRAAPPVREIPVVVLTSDMCFEFVPDGGGADATCQAWRAAHDRLATLLDAEHITDTNSSHFIQGEQPQLVVDAVRQVVDETRSEDSVADGQYQTQVKDSFGFFIGRRKTLRSPRGPTRRLQTASSVDADPLTSEKIRWWMSCAINYTQSDGA